MTGKRHSYGHGITQFVSGDPKARRPVVGGWKKKNKAKARARREARQAEQAKA